MNNINKLKLTKLFLSIFCLLQMFFQPCFAQYANYRIIEPREGNEPQPLAILWSKNNASALVEYKGEHLYVKDKIRIDNEWTVKEIKHESIIFGRTSQKKYVEFYINPDKRPHKKYRTWSFYGVAITFWEAAKLLTDAFNYSAVMHNYCSGSVIPQRNGTSFNELIKSIVSDNISVRLENNTLYILPANPPLEKNKDILERRKAFNHKALTMRFDGLKKEGTINSKGDDIQYILRVISIGGEVPISFPKNLHFSVYANYKNVPFYKILSDIIYINQCIIAERESGIEIIQWPGLRFQEENKDATKKEPVLLPKPEDKYLKVDPVHYDEISGSGPYPPPVLDDPKMLPEPILNKVNKIKNKKTAPVVFQPSSSTSRKKVIFQKEEYEEAEEIKESEGEKEDQE